VRLIAIAWARVAGLILLTGVSVAADVDPTRVTPVGQPPLAVYGAEDLQPLRDAFNAAADDPRVLAMFSPT